ncbi:hypothetical protein HQ520_02615 [bacterium]|nr:hypothetical protein [bacterium]
MKAWLCMNPISLSVDTGLAKIPAAMEGVISMHAVFKTKAAARKMLKDRNLIFLEVTVTPQVKGESHAG